VVLCLRPYGCASAAARYYYTVDKHALQATAAHVTLWPEYLDGGRSSAYYLQVPLRADWDGTTPLPIDLEPDAKSYRSLPPDRGRKKHVAVGRTPQSSGSTTSAIGADAVDVSCQPSLGCHYIADLLAANEIDVVFGMTGGHAPCTRSQSWHSSRVTGESRDTLGNRTLGRQAWAPAHVCLRSTRVRVRALICILANVGHVPLCIHVRKSCVY
jgi:hypothetical protein